MSAAQLLNPKAESRVCVLIFGRDLVANIFGSDAAKP